ncbi:phosphoribosylformylglycinamidine synthase subunit PurL [bacterium]
MENFVHIGILNADEQALIKISADNLLSLNINEMKAIQNYYKKIGRNPTDVELETIAQTWSEHCKHKTLMGLIEYTRINQETGEEQKEIIDNLLKSTIVRATKELNKDWCLSVFKDNAGVIEFDEHNGVAFKVETHNHPSALEPYGGAGTGIGGVIRDILGVGLGAKPIFNTDVFCFGMPDECWETLPKGVLHPKQIMKGVVEGVRDYGNRMGIPTINGAVLFDEGFTFNPLVYCGTAGIMPKSSVNKSVKSGDYILAVGGRTGRDGIHGATFSSLALDENTESSAVQIGNPIVEKKILDTLLDARDRGLYRGLTDCGAGGFSSAVGELGEDTGVEVYLEKAPLKYEGLKPWEIWVSEAQERMVLSVPPENLDETIKLFEAEDVEAKVLGKFTDTKKLILYYKDEKVCELDMNFLHGGVPRYTRKAIWKTLKQEHYNWKEYEKENHTEILLKILSHPNVCSKEWIIRQYDHEVQGGSVIKPLQGRGEGPGDGAVVKPLFDSFKGVGISCGINSEYGKIDPYWMTLANIDEALRNLLCLGGSLERAAFLDNFCWGDPNDERELAGIVRAAKACYDASIIYGIPFVSGKDSLNNTYLNRDGQQTSIPETLLVSAIGVLEDIKKCVSMYLKESGNLLYIIGYTKNELGGSIYSIIKKQEESKNIYDTRIPKVELALSKKIMDSVNTAISQKLITSCHDCSEGGIAACISEMALAGRKGVEIDIESIPVLEDDLPINVKLFSESCSRFVVEVNPENKEDFEKAVGNIPFALIGKVNDSSNNIAIKNGSKTLINKDIEILEKSWKNLSNNI